MMAMLVLEADVVLAAELKRLKSSATPFDTERDFWLATELKLCVARLHVTALQSLQCATVGRPSAATVPQCSPGELAECVRKLATLRSTLAERMRARVATSSRLPLALELSREYGWSEVELDAFVTLVLIQGGHASDAFATICLDDVDDGVGDAKLLRALSGMSALVTLRRNPNPPAPRVA